jgi:3',5'-cyclic-AMP phosphodiesterase
MPGNHDERASLRAAFPEHTYLQHVTRVASSSTRSTCPAAPGALDTVVPGAAHGALCEHRLTWLEDTLAAAPDTPTLLAMHHPPFLTHIGHMDAMGLLQGVEAFNEIVARHRQVERIVCGHIHRSIQCQVAHAVAITVPSTAHQIALDIGDSPGGYTLEPPGMGLHVWRNGAGLVTHVLNIGDFDGPFPFT